MENDKHDPPKTSAKAAPKAHLWKPGQSGNPAGTKRGSRHKASLLAESLLDGETDRITRRCIYEAHPSTRADFEVSFQGKALKFSRGAPIALDPWRFVRSRPLPPSRELKRYPGFTFTSPIDLAKYLKSTGILDLLVYAEELALARAVAEGFIHEMAKKVAGDQKLDFEGMPGSGLWPARGDPLRRRHLRLSALPRELGVQIVSGVLSREHVHMFVEIPSGVYLSPRCEQSARCPVGEWEGGSGSLDGLNEDNGDTATLIIARREVAWHFC